jgi:hypothetical protein
MIIKLETTRQFTQDNRCMVEMLSFYCTFFGTFTWSLVFGGLKFENTHLNNFWLHDDHQTFQVFL